MFDAVPQLLNRSRAPGPLTQLRGRVEVVDAARVPNVEVDVRIAASGGVTQT